MVITLGQARTAIAEYAGKSGKCPESEGVRLFVIEVVQALLHKGAHGNLRKWSFCTCNGCFTAPEDMEVPLKVKIDGYPEKVWSKWYEFYDVHSSDLTAKDYQGGLIEEVNRYYTIYDIPCGGARVAPIPLECEANDAHIIVQGLDTTGKEVFTKYKEPTTGRECQVHGERIPISRTTPVYSRTTFSKITGIEKSQTCNYVRLYWYQLSPVEGEVLSKGLLAEYKPTDIHPSYRRFGVPAAEKDCCVKVTVLGRIKDIEYRHDNDILPVTSLSALRNMALAINATRNEKVDVALFHEQLVDKVIEEENQYYRTGGEPFDIFIETSPGAIENLL